ncbi:MAG: N-acetylneuraminate synthase [Bacteroidetes bacterium]|nr:N-acetylneuraminate synthase [Bacteroidota bacterium]MBP8074216.1 N-acetylneuraminate synthase [Bacteroidia bacterium]
MNLISIADRKIGPGFPCFIIAEAGVNHNGDPALARELIVAAAEAGADAVKFQTFKAEKLVTKSAKMADYQVQNTGQESSQLDMLRKLELQYDAHRELKDFAESLGLIFLSTPFDLEGIDFLKDLGVVAFKAGSGDLTNLPYLRKMASQGLPMIISTGMAVLEECHDAVNAIREAGDPGLVVLHCTTNYPCPEEEVNLLAMQTMGAALKCLVGYSDHTDGILVPQLAVAAGACVIEKHYTLDRNMEGPDHKASLEPHELKDMIQRIRQVEKIMGHGDKIPNPSELRIMEAARKSIVAAKDIPAGTLISVELLDIKRPGTGISPKKMQDLTGRRAKVTIEADTIITWDMLE